MQVLIEVSLSWTRGNNQDRVWGRIKNGIDTSVPGTLGLKIEKNGEVECAEKIPAVLSTLVMIN